MTIIPYSVNRKDTWDSFVKECRQCSFVFQRAFMDLHANGLFDCSLLVYQGISPDDEYKESKLGIQDLVAVFPANWVEDEKTVYSHGGLPYGGLLTLEEVTQADVLKIMQKVLMYYQSYLGADYIVYKPVPYIFSRIPSGEDLYALFRAGAVMDKREVSTCVDIRNPQNMRTLSIRQAKKALENGLFIERMAEADWDSLNEFWKLVEKSDEEGNCNRLSYSLEEMKALMQLFPKNIRAFVVRNSLSLIVAGVIVFETDRVALLENVANSSEGRKNGALDLLLRHLCGERYKDMEYIDFGISTENNAKSLNESLIFQKEGFGGSTVCYDTYRVYLDRERLEHMLEIDMIPEDKMGVRFLDMNKIAEKYEPTLSHRVEKVMKNGKITTHDESSAFEKSFSEYCGTENCILCGTGLDALKLILYAYRFLKKWNEGDEIILSGGMFSPTAIAVIDAGFRPVFVDIDKNSYLSGTDNIRKAITQKTRAVICVDLFGRLCMMDEYASLCKENGLILIEDAAQAVGAKQNGVKAGHFGNAAAFSFHKHMNLGTIGDIGCVVTDDAELADIVREMAYFTSRCDEFLAATLNVKLPYLDKDNDYRREIAKHYSEHIDNPMIGLPERPENDEECVWNKYAIRVSERDRIIAYLKEHCIETKTSHNVPKFIEKLMQNINSETLPNSERFKDELLFLPLSQVIKIEDVDKVIDIVNRFVV